MATEIWVHHLRAFTKISLKITSLKLNWNLPGANELKKHRPTEYFMGIGIVAADATPQIWDDIYVFMYFSVAGMIVCVDGNIKCFVGWYGGGGVLV